MRAVIRAIAAPKTSFFLLKESTTVTLSYSRNMALAMLTGRKTCCYELMDSLGTQQLPIYRIQQPCHSRVPLAGIQVLRLEARQNHSGMTEEEMGYQQILRPLTPRPQPLPG